MVSCSATIASLVKQTDVSRGHCMSSLLHFTADALIPHTRFHCCIDDDDDDDDSSGSGSGSGNDGRNSSSNSTNNSTYNTNKKY